MQQTAQPAGSDERLSFLSKLAYGSGDLGTAITASLRAFFLLFFLTDVARLSPAAAASILLINRLWDAVNDPIIGWLSDRTVTRWGRRRPWILAGALPFGLLFFLTWWVPPLDATGKFIYYTVIVLLLDTVYTIINVPYAALTAELSHNYDERTSLNSFRFAFSVGGSLVSAVLHPIIVGMFVTVQTGYLASGALWGLISALSCVSVFLGTREPETSTTAPAHQEDEIPQRQQLAIVFANRSYRFVVGIYLFSWLALQLVSAVLVYYMTYYMGRAEQIPLVLAAIQGTAFIFLFVWGALSRRMEKSTVYIMGATLWLVMQMLLYFITPAQSWLVLPVAVLAGAGVAVAYLIPWAMLPDVIEFDEWETGRRREGVFYGFMVFLQKVGIALGIFLVGQALGATGYVTPTDAVPVPVQPESALQSIRLFMGPIPALILAGSLAMAYFYPITRAKHSQMRQALAARRAEQAALRASQPAQAGA